MATDKPVSRKWYRKMGQKPISKIYKWFQNIFQSKNTDIMHRSITIGRLNNSGTGHKKTRTLACKTAINSRIIGKRKTPPTFGVAKQKTLPTFDVAGQEVDSCFKKSNLLVTGFSTIVTETKVQIYTQAEAIGRELARHMM